MVPEPGVGLLLVALRVMVSVKTAAAPTAVVPVVGVVPMLPIDEPGAAPIPRRVAPIKSVPRFDEVRAYAPEFPGQP